jgi:hypothetical protein
MVQALCEIRAVCGDVRQAAAKFGRFSLLHVLCEQDAGRGSCLNGGVQASKARVRHCRIGGWTSSSAVAVADLRRDPAIFQDGTQSARHFTQTESAER